MPRQQVSLPVGTTVEVLVPPTEPSATDLRSLFASTGEESFEDGCDSDFSAELTRIILTHGHEAVEFVSVVMRENSLPSEVAAQTPRCLGELRQSQTDNARRELLERSLKNSSHVIRDGTLIGLSWLNDPLTIPALETALDCEDHEFLRANLSKLTTRLKG